MDYDCRVCWGWAWVSAVWKPDDGDQGHCLPLNRTEDAIASPSQGHIVRLSHVFYTKFCFVSGLSILVPLSSSASRRQRHEIAKQNNKLSSRLFLLLYILLSAPTSPCFFTPTSPCFFPPSPPSIPCGSCSSAFTLGFNLPSFSISKIMRSSPKCVLCSN